MPFAAALSNVRHTGHAMAEICQRALEQLQGSPDLAMLFYSPNHMEAVPETAAKMQERLAARCLLGCAGESVIGDGREVEHQPALSLWLARWPRGVEQESFHLQLAETPDGQSLLGWPDGILSAEPSRSAVLLLGDPRTFPVDMFLEQVNENYPKLPVLGGMASGLRPVGDDPRQSADWPLILDGQAINAGAVGVLLQGPIGLRSIVSQGCRPIGRHMVITSGERNIISGLSGKPPLVQLQQLWKELSPRDQQLFQQGLHIGLVIDEYRGEFHRGDFLVRNVLGLDRQTGSLAITDRIRVGQTIQFHVRDAETADEDLKALLQMDMAAHERRPAAALLFSCNGRGTRLFTEPHHDVAAIRSVAGNIPVAGHFAAGELGPVQGRNYIHGFTASIALFEEARD